MDINELRGRLLAWSDQKAWRSDEEICSSTLNLVRFHESSESSYAQELTTPQESFVRNGLFSLIHVQDTSFSDVLASQLQAEDLLGIAYYLSRYRGAMRDYALNKLCLKFPVLNDKRYELSEIIANSKKYWPPSDGDKGRFLYNDVALNFGDLQEVPCSLGGTWSSLMLRIPDYQVSFRSDKRVGNLTPLVLELSDTPFTSWDYVEYAFCGEGLNMAAEILVQAGEIVYGTQFKMHNIRKYVLDEKNKSRFMDQLLAYPDSWMFPVSDASTLSDELLGDRLSHLFVSTYLAQPVYHRAIFLKDYANTDLVETAGSLDDIFQCIRQTEALRGV
jgi:hypothetical protein